MMSPTNIQTKDTKWTKKIQKLARECAPLTNRKLNPRLQYHNDIIKKAPRQQQQKNAPFETQAGKLHMLVPACVKLP